MKAEDFLTAPSAEDFLTGADGSGEMTIPVKRRRGTEKARYVPGENLDNPIAPTGGSVLEGIKMPAPTFDEERKGRAGLDALFAKMPVRGPRPTRDLAGVARDVMSIAGNTGVQLVKPLVDIANIPMLGAFDPVSSKLGELGQNYNHFASPTTNYDRQTLSDMPEGASLDKVAHLVSNPGLAANMGVPSVASMAMPLAVAKGAGILFPKTAAALGEGFQTGAAVGSNALLNAGDTFGQTQADIGGRLLAALGAGASSALVGKATGGGLEGQLARGGKIPTWGAALKGIGNESLQEGGENFGNQLAQDTGEGKPLNFGAALDQAAIGATLAPFVSGPINVAGVVSSPERANARLLSDAINGFDPSVLFPNPVDNSISQPGPRFDPVAAAQANAPRMRQPEIATPQLPYDPAVQNPAPPMVVDQQGNARPMTADEFLTSDTTRQEQQDTGLTPDVRKAISDRNVNETPTAPDVPSDLLDRLRAAGWTPPQEGNNPKPDPTTVQGIGKDLESLYQKDVKDGIKQRLGIDQPAAPTAPAEKPPASYAESPFLREIAARGGVNMEQRSDTNVDANRQTNGGRVMPNPYNIGGKPLFRPDGLRGDALVEGLVSQGYLTQKQVDEADAGGVGGSDELAYDMIRRELAQPGSVKPINMQESAGAQAGQARASTELDDKARSIGFDTKGLSEDQINLALKRIERRLQRSQGRADVARETKAERAAIDTVHANPDVNYDDASIPWDGPGNTSTADFLRAMGASEQEIQDALAAESSQTGQRVQNPGQAAPNEPAGPAGPARTNQGSEGRPAAPADNASVDTSAGQPQGLTSYTPEELRQRDERIRSEAQAEAKQQAERDAADKATRDQKEIQSRQDSSAENFQLGQDANDSLSGQRGMFSKPSSVTDKPFYSALSRQVSAIPAKAQPSAGWIANIDGLIKAGKVKADEVQWSGVLDFLKMQEGKVTRDQVVQFLDQNGVKVTETVLGQKDAISVEVVKDGKDEKYPFAIMVNGVEENRLSDRDAAEDEAQSLRDDPSTRRLYRISDDNTKYGQYQLPGGTNPREVLLTLPAKRVWVNGEPVTEEDLSTQSGRDAADRVASYADATFQSPHWDQPNVVAHVRVNDRTDASGARVLFVEEFQAEKGQEWQKLKTKIADGTATDVDKTRFDFLDQNFPFNKTDAWLSLALKRVIKMAVDGGYDKVAFINGEQSADRYDLSKSVSQIAYDSTLDGGTLIADAIDAGPASPPIIDKTDIKPEQLADYIGKEAADRILNNPTSKDGTMHVISGDGLKVGGEGMRAFYDKIVPNTLKDVLHKLGGGELSESTITLHKAGEPGSGDLRDTVSKQTAFDITPAMREKAAGGLPLFSRANPKAGTSTPDTIRTALTSRFGDLIPKMEARGFLKIWPNTQAFNDGQTSEHLEGPVQGYWDGKQAHLFADGIAPGNEVAVLLHEVGEHASMEDMLGPNHYGRLVSRAHDLVDQGDPTATQAMDRIPADTPRQYVDSELLAYMIETVASDGAKATPSARKWLADVVAAIRAWFAQTGFNKMLDRYGKGLELTPEDIAALAVRAVKWQAEQGGAGGRGTKQSVATPKDVVGNNQGGRSADDKTPGATQSFDEWFKGSKVVDANGLPRLVGGAYIRSKLGKLWVVGKLGQRAYAEGKAQREAGDASTFNDAKKPYWIYEEANGDMGTIAYLHAMFAAGVKGFPLPAAVVGKRRGAVPSSGVSYNSRDQVREVGVSTSHILKNGKWVDPSDGTYAMFNNVGEMHYIVGFPVPHASGTDGEVLLVSATDLGPVKEGNVRIAKDVPNESPAPDSGGARLSRPARPVQSTAAQQAANVFGGSNATIPPGGNAGNPQGPSAAAQQAPWSVAEPDRLDNVIRRMQDNRIDIRRTVDAVKATGAQIADEADPYLMDELYIGKVRSQIDTLADDHVKPLLAAIGNSGFTLEQVNDYLWARHAEEYNRQMAKVNDVPFTQVLDLAGMSTTDANAKMAVARALPNFAQMQAIARMVDTITSDARTRMVTDGLAEPGMIQAWEGAYKYYVPFQRDVEESGGKASGYNVKGPESRRAMGSTKEVVNILANVIAQAEAVIIRSEKVVVGRSVLDMARQNPNPDFWTVDRPPTERAIDPRTGLVTTRVKPNYKALDNVFVVKEAGVEHFVTFNEKNPRAVQFARSLKNMDVVNLGPVMQVISKGTRYLARWVTSRNPLFWMTNFARDIQGVAFNLQNTPLKGQAPQVMAKVPQALAGVASNKLKGTGKWAQLAQEFADAGGQTGYLDNYRDSVERMGEIEKEIKRMQQGKADPRRIARAVLDVIDGANDVIENGVRLAVYAQAREHGLSEAKSASIAKNISVNFNRKGNDTAIYNALFMFFNANVQGNMRMIQAVKESRRAQVYAGALTMAGAAVALLNWQLGGDDEESRKKRYQLVPEWERERNWIVFIPGTSSYVKIPLPLGPHVLFNAGRVLAELGIEKGADPMEKAASFVSSVIGAFNPVGGGLPSADAKGIAQVATPTVVRPMVDLVVNQNFAGTPVAKEKSPFGYNKPAYGSGRESTPSYWTSAAKAMNDWTGGDSIKPGTVNLAPEQLAYLLKGYVMPGITQTADKIAGQAMSRKATPIDQIVGVSKFFGTIDENERSRAFFETARKDREKAGQYAAYLKDGQRDKANDLLTKWGGGDMAKGRRLLGDAKNTEKQMSAISKERRSVQALPEDVRDERQNRIDERQNRMQAVFLRNRAALTESEE